MTLEQLFVLAEIEDRAMQLPIIPYESFVKVQRKLGIPTSNEREAEMIKQRLYPFADAIQLKKWRYVIYAIPYLKWINERIPELAYPSQQLALPLLQPDDLRQVRLQPHKLHPF